MCVCVCSVCVCACMRVCEESVTILLHLQPTYQQLTSPIYKTSSQKSWPSATIAIGIYISGRNTVEPRIKDSSNIKGKPLNKGQSSWTWHYDGNTCFHAAAQKGSL